MNNDRQGIGLSAGGLTLLVIFTVLCLTVFGILSLSAAQADDRLTQKSLLLTEQYYEADGRCEEALKSVDIALREAKTLSADEAGYWEMVGASLEGGYDGAARTYSFTENINDSLIIDVCLKLNYSGARLYDIAHWKTVSVRVEEFEDTMNLWTGD